MELKNKKSEFLQEKQKFEEQAKPIKIETKKGTLPWTINNEKLKNKESELKKQILLLSEEQWNFLQPANENFKFDYDSHLQDCQIILEVDKKLNDWRFVLVPRKVKENEFWRNYFYRVQLIRQAVLGSEADVANETINILPSTTNSDSATPVATTTTATITNTAHTTQKIIQDSEKMTENVSKQVIEQREISNEKAVEGTKPKESIKINPKPTNEPKSVDVSIPENLEKSTETSNIEADLKAELANFDPNTLNDDEDETISFEESVKKELQADNNKS